MGIWLELGIFIVVLLWGFWQLRDVKKAMARRLAPSLAIWRQFMPGRRRSFR